MLIKQVVVTGQHQVELQSVKLPEALAPDEILIRTECTFISAGTELANYTGKEPQVFQKGSWCAYPWRSGYANVGMVTAIGERVTRCSVGQRVFTCGPHASAVCVNQDTLVVPVPDGLDPVVAVASRLAGVATSAVAVAPLPVHPLVVVFGLGMVGNLAAQAFRILGGQVLGVDPLAARRDLAGRCGIQTLPGGSADDVCKAVAQRTGGRLADIVVDATGLTPVILDALKVTANVGQFILLGSPRAPSEGNLTALLSEIHLRNLVVRGALEWCLPVYPPVGMWGYRTLPLLSLYDKQCMIFDWLLAGQMKLEPLISHRLPPAQVKEAYDGLLKQPESFTGVALDWR